MPRGPIQNPDNETIGGAVPIDIGGEGAGEGQSQNNEVFRFTASGDDFDFLGCTVDVKRPIFGDKLSDSYIIQQTEMLFGEMRLYREDIWPANLMYEFTIRGFNRDNGDDFLQYVKDHLGTQWALDSVARAWDVILMNPEVGYTAYGIGIPDGNNNRDPGAERCQISLRLMKV